MKRPVVIARVVELPYWSRASGWWAGLSPREKILVGTLGALLVAAVLVFVIVKPLQAARADALADIRTYETLNARIRAAGTLGRPSVPQRTGPPAAIVGASAASFGLAPVVQPVPGGIRVTFSDAGYDAVMNWMADLARTSTLTATRVELRRAAAPGHVSATVEYRG